ncbi:MAG: LysR family transcriptional regulator [Hyphomicrobiaceae bacterium]|nr:LysR family transcriptional regulator [Hyphomicrobiaceae bacterium]
MGSNQTVGPRLRVVIAPGIGIGPGKAALLEGIRETGSIAAAGRRIGMSYKRAWLLVVALNSHFELPLIEASKGGKTGGGATLTALGEEVLAAYREMERRAGTAVAPVIARLSRLARPAR